MTDQTEEQKIVNAAIASTLGKRGKPSAYKLAQELGVNLSAITAWKQGLAKPNSNHLLALLRRARAGGLYIMLSPTRGIFAKERRRRVKETQPHGTHALH